MSATEGKVCIDGIIELNGEKYLSLQYLQARDPSLCKKPFLAKYDPNAVWFDQLECLTLPHTDGHRKTTLLNNRIHATEII